MKVKALPKKDIEVEICDIYEDRKAVIVQHTDTLLYNTAYNVEALCFKYNLKSCAFIWPYGGIQGQDLIDIHKTGIIKLGVYIPTDRYRSEDRASYLPDYTSSKITTQLSADYYGKQIGDEKPSRVQQGQDLFDYTNGVKGYDVKNSIPGSENNMDFVREMNYIDEWYKSNFGRLPSSGSDRQGVIGSKEIYLPHYLGVRKTTPNVQNYDYLNISRLDFIHREITSRYEYGFEVNLEMRKRLLRESITLALENNGMFNDFSHWHRAISHGNNIQLLEELYQDIHFATKEHYIWSTGYSEAVEYYWYRKMTKRVRGSFINDILHLIADFDDELINRKFAGLEGKILYNRIHQSLSVKIDLTNTIFENKEIESNIGEIIKLGNNMFIVNIPFNQKNGFQELTIQIADSPEYKNFNKPYIVLRTENKIELNKPCKIVVYNGDFKSTMSVLYRSNEFSKHHTINFDISSKLVGVIDKDGNTILI